MYDSSSGLLLCLQRWQPLQGIFMNVLSVQKSWELIPLLTGGFNEGRDQGGKKLQWQESWKGKKEEAAAAECAHKEEVLVKECSIKGERNVIWNIGRMMVRISLVDLQNNED